jgi:acyl carrier protein
LHTDSIGVYDNFFDLGGDSLACIEVMSAVLESLNVELTAQHIFECENLEALAQRVDILPNAESPELGGHDGHEYLE